MTSIQVKGIIGRIGTDAKHVNGEDYLVDPTYPRGFLLAYIHDEQSTRTVFNKKDISMYVQNPDGTTREINNPDLYPQEYVFDAVVTKISIGGIRITNIVVKGINS
jgi:hypothetical protein